MGSPLRSRDFVDRAVFSQTILWVTISFATGVLVGAWHSLRSLLIMLVAYEVIMVCLFPGFVALYVLSAAFYVIGWMVGVSLFPCGRTNLFTARSLAANYHLARGLK